MHPRKTEIVGQSYISYVLNVMCCLSAQHHRGAQILHHGAENAEVFNMQAERTIPQN